MRHRGNKIFDISTHMGNVNVFLPKFFRQTLRQSSCAKFTSSKCTRKHVSLSAWHSSSEDQSTSFSIRLFDIVVLERQNGATGKGKCGSYVDLETILNILRRDVKKWLPETVRNVKNRDTNDIFRFREFCVDGLPGGGDVVIGIRRHGEWCCLE